MRIVLPRSAHPAGILRSAILLLAFQCLSEHLARAQFSQPTFRAVTELHSGRDARGVFTGDFNGDGRADLGTYGPTQIILHIREQKGDEWKTLPVPGDAAVTDAVAGRFNGDRIDDIAALTENPSEVSLFTGNKRGRFARSWHRPVGGNLENMYRADINADGVDDLLLYGPKELGMTALLGQRNGEFRPDTLLFPEYSVNALTVADLNADGLNDLIVSNWVSNELLVYTSFGTLKYSEPLAIRIEEGVKSVATGFINGDANPDIVVLTARGMSCLIYAGDGYGGFTRTQEVTLDAPASALLLTNVNSDKKQDLLFLDASGAGIRVQMSDSAGVFGRPAYLGGGKRPLMMCAFSEGAPRSTSIALLDGSESTIRIFHNEAGNRSSARDLLVATGCRPGTIAFTDVNRDAHPDVVVANGGSRQLSVYLNRGDDTFGGQIAVETPDMPVSLAYVATSDTAGVFFTMPEARDEIVATWYQPGAGVHRSVIYPLQRSLEILPGGISVTGGGLRVTTIERRTDSARGTLIGLEEIAAGRFRERVISPPAPSSLVAALIRDVNADGVPDLVCVVRDSGGRGVRVFEGLGNSQGTFDTLRPGFPLEIADSTGARIWLKDVNGDGVPDLLVNVHSPVNELSIALGRRDTTFFPPMFRFKNAISVAADENLQAMDLNGDGLTDIILLNDLKREIQLYIGKGNGSFWPAIRVASAEGCAGFAIGNLNNDIEPELIMTDSANNLLRIITLHEQ